MRVVRVCCQNPALSNIRDYWACCACSSKQQSSRVSGRLSADRRWRSEYGVRFAIFRESLAAACVRACQSCSNMWQSKMHTKVRCIRTKVPRVQPKVPYAWGTTCGCFKQPYIWGVSSCRNVTAPYWHHGGPNRHDTWSSLVGNSVAGRCCQRFVFQQTQNQAETLA
jgi:hypothetical protein